MKTALTFSLLLEIFAGVTHARAFGEDTPPNMNGQYREELGILDFYKHSNIAQNSKVWLFAVKLEPEIEAAETTYKWDLY